ncbi:MAG TPA: hypothetical protein DCX92_00780, partial [Bacteroidetes bacterium]|nr:hypothetical protein [Bacteroidota bacterium]
MKFKTPNLSIFIKLILVVFIFGILLNICVLFVFQATSDKKPRKFLKDFSRRMERHLVYEIGIPPDTVKAKQICEDLDIEMRYEGTPYNWSSNGEIPDLRSILNDPGDRVRFEENESIIAHHEGEPYSVIR